jgi:hypothetical protein
VFDPDHLLGVTIGTNVGLTHEEDLCTRRLAGVGLTVTIRSARIG